MAFDRWQVLQSFGPRFRFQVELDCGHSRQFHSITVLVPVVRIAGTERRHHGALRPVRLSDLSDRGAG